MKEQVTPVKGHGSVTPGRGESEEGVMGWAS